MMIDELLGNYEKRYFGAGHKRTVYYMNRFLQKEGERTYSSAEIENSNGTWSEKAGIEQKPHLSTIDGIVLAVMFAERYMQEYLGESEIEKLFLASFEIKAGISPIENLKDIRLSMKVPEVSDCGSTFQIEILGMRIKISFQKREENDAKVRKQNGEAGKNYFSEHLKYVKHDIRDIVFDGDNISCNVVRELERSVNFCGVESAFADSLSILEWLVIFSQMGQVLAYHIDSVDRKVTETLWMKWVKAEMKEPYRYDKEIFVSGGITKRKWLKMGGETWSLFEMAGSALDNLIRFEGKITHKLPQKKEGERSDE